jgi:hypothetical protein
MLGLHVLDRFVGRMNPVFRASRLGVDLHYNPPGIRGEPRYLEGVVRLTKLHGSIDWRRENDAGYTPARRSRSSARPTPSRCRSQCHRRCQCSWRDSAVRS